MTPSRRASQPWPPATRRLVTVALILALVAVGWLLLRGVGSGDGAQQASTSRPTTSTARASQPASSNTGAQGATSRTSRASSNAGSGDLPGCDLGGLPEEARRTAALIRRGGPFPYPRNDGVTFYNSADRLPVQPEGYYREYTVTTPGAKTRGARRIVTGGTPATDPPHWYYTGDHYESFCRVTGR